MKILCINTAFPQAEIILKTESKTIFESLDSNAKTSEHILPKIEQILNENQLNPQDINIIAIVVGPGSFTGIRVGMAIVKGFLAVFNNIKVVAINSLDLMAQEYKNSLCSSNNFYCVQNALPNRFFLAQYTSLGQLIGNYRLVNELPNETLVGLLSENLDCTTNNIEIKAQTFLNYVEEKIIQKDFTDNKNLQPVYLRLSQAEENLNRKSNEN